MRKKKVNYTDTYVSIGANKIPLRIFIERRSTIRIALGKEFVILRIPLYLSSQINKHVESARDWLLKIGEKDSSLISKYYFSPAEFNNELLVLSKDRFKISIAYLNEEDFGDIKIVENEMKIRLSKKMNDVEKKLMIRNLISKLLVKRYKKYAELRLNYWNEKFFNKKIKGLTLRYNSSNWGSCSTRNKINISTRSLLLPMDVFDYILVHELSHLVEMNHSEKFWKVVKNVMPDYEKHEKWLKNNGSKIDF